MSVSKHESQTYDMSNLSDNLDNKDSGACFTVGKNRRQANDELVSTRK